MLFNLRLDEASHDINPNPKPEYKSSEMKNWNIFSCCRLSFWGHSCIMNIYENHESFIYMRAKFHLVSLLRLFLCEHLYIKHKYSVDVNSYFFAEDPAEHHQLLSVSDRNSWCSSPLKEQLVPKWKMWSFISSSAWRWEVFTKHFWKFAVKI